MQAKFLTLYTKLDLWGGVKRINIDIMQLLEISMLTLKQRCQNQISCQAVKYVYIFDSQLEF